MKYFIFLFTLFLIMTSGEMYAWHDYNKDGKQKDIQINLRENCAFATAAVDLTINNVRAHLLNGGDVWWNYTNGQYIVPKVEAGTGVKEVSSIFAAAVWIAGYTQGNLKGAARTYGGGGQNDWRPGPLDPETGEITIKECQNWDRFFEVSAADIDLFKRNLVTAASEGRTITEAEIPLSLKSWPAKGNPYFKRIYNWDLPFTNANLAPFFDAPTGARGTYDPIDGDYPIIEVRGIGGACFSNEDYNSNPPYGDQMFFWIYNDNAGPHSEFGGEPIKMEVQVQAYAFRTNDALNDMTFMRYKLVNRATETIDDCLFGWWVDSDLGCSEDDLIGCDSARSLVYYYNVDGTDGNTGNPPINCVPPGGSATNTYGFQVPILGIDYFEGPTVDVPDGPPVDIGMTSFTYYNRVNDNNPNTEDPATLTECYRYMNAQWKNGREFRTGGNGYDTDGPITRFPFPADPCDLNGWNMKTANVDGIDRRTVQATGPIRLERGKTNFLVVGVPWVPDQQYTGPNNCPSLDDLRRADDICQGLFDNCFQIFDGPDAPDVDIIELDQKLILALSNNPSVSNNYDLNYTGFNPGISPSKEEWGLFKFEGYQIYQMINPSVSLADLDDNSKFRLVAQVDLKNDITNIYNWTPMPNPHYDPSNPTGSDSIKLLWIPELKVGSENKGLRNTFEISEDQFAVGDKKLINHKKYYYTAVAYAYNNWKNMDYTGEGQSITFARGRRNGQVYDAIPRPVVDRYLNSAYGDGVIITRLDGKGSYQSFLDLADGEHDRLLNLGNNPDKKVVFKEKAGPVLVKVYNPVDIVDGEMTLTIRDSVPGDNSFNTGQAWWELKDNDGNVLVADEDFDKFNEKLIADYGISIFFNNSAPGIDRDEINGYVGQRADYKAGDANGWLSFLSDGLIEISGLDIPGLSILLSESMNWIQYEPNPNNTRPDIDPENVYEKLSFFPALLATRESKSEIATLFFTPIPIGTTLKNNVYNRTSLEKLNNVDIVFTPDKSKWSRCVVVESTNETYTDFGFPSDGNARGFTLRRAFGTTLESDGNGNPVYRTDSTGISYFPGYAIDPETGTRLNIFFGENSSFSPDQFKEVFEAEGIPENICQDMIWNPTGDFLINANVTNLASPSNFFAGGHHYIYVTNTAYNGCADVESQLRVGNPNDARRANAVSQVSWVAFPLANSPMKSWADGLVPGEMIYKIRVNHDYGISDFANGTTGANDGMPQYHLKIDKKAYGQPDKELITSALDSISIVPNPYYAYSEYEVSEISNVVKITNLPAKCVVTIYSVDGKFIRQFNRNETREERGNSRGIRYAQVTPDLEWDMKNSKGISVASGIYLVHIKSDEGERVIKWVGAIRQLEISGF